MQLNYRRRARIFRSPPGWITAVKEREAFYQAETIRRIAEAPGEGGNAAVQLLREHERMASIKTREGLKIGGIINIGVGIGVTIFLRISFTLGRSFLPA